MLKVIYQGYHRLNLNSAFRESAWAGIYSGYSDDPLVQSISHLQSLLEERGGVFIGNSTWLEEIRQLKSKSRNTVPKLFIISGYEMIASLKEILDEVKSGSNLAVILPQFAVVVDQNIEERFTAFINDVSNELGTNIEETRHVSFGEGQVFFFSGYEVDDLHLEDGPFGAPELATYKKKKARLLELVESLTTFRIPFIDCVVSSLPSSWPRDEGLIVELELLNRSEHIISEASVLIEFLPEFEPISSCQIDLYLFDAKSSRSVSILTIPRKKGVFRRPISASVRFGGMSYTVHLQESQIKIVENLTRMMRFSETKHIPLEKFLEDFAEYFAPIATPLKLLNLATNDPDSAVLKARRLGEHVAKTIAKELIPQFNASWTFARTTRELYDRGLISTKAKGYIDHIRTLGNHAAHSDGNNIVSFNTEDAQQSYYALYLFLKDFDDSANSRNAA